MTVHFLGTGSANAGPDRTTSMLAVEHRECLILVDCGGDAILRMQACGLDPVSLDAVILTHEHPDHLSGFPLLVEKLWLMGRRDPIAIYGPSATLKKARALFDVYDTHKWKDVPDRVYHNVEMAEGSAVVSVGDVSVTASPVDHPVPTIGLRFETPDSVLSYSCDTAPCDAVVALADGCDVLIHEATGDLPGVHSSAAQAADIALRAGAGRLLLIHAPAEISVADLDAARSAFSDTAWADDGDRVELVVADQK